MTFSSLKFEKNAAKKIENAKKKILVEFTARLQDRYGNQMELKGLVEEGTTRTDALAKLVREHGGICEMENGKGELSGLRWITKIEFKNGFKIEKWGQYTNAKGEFEIGKVKNSLLMRLASIFLKKFKTTAFWENGDTKRVTERDNFVVFREDYGVTADLPSPNNILGLDEQRRFIGGCSNSLKEGEIELVKMAARIDFKRECYLVDLDSKHVRKEKKYMGGGDCKFQEIFMPKKHVYFDVVAQNSFESEIREWQNSFFIKRTYYAMKKLAEGNSFFNDEEAESCGAIKAMPNLFFSRYQQEDAKYEEKEAVKEKTAEENTSAEEIWEERKNRKKEEKREGEPKNIQTKQAKIEIKTTESAATKELQSQEKSKIFAIINKLKDDEKPQEKENKAEESQEKKQEIIEKEKIKVKNLKDKLKKDAEKTKIEKDSKIKVHNNKPKKKKKQNKKEKRKKEKKPEKKKKKEKYAAQKEKKKIEKAAKKQKIEKIKLPKIKIKIKKIKAPKTKHLCLSMRKGAELAHKMYLLALKKIEKKKRMKEIILAKKKIKKR